MLKRLLSTCGLIFLAACGNAATPTRVTPPSVPSNGGPPAILIGPDTAGTLRPVACPFVLPDGLIEGTDVECVYLPVLEQRQGDSAGTGRTIRLAVALFHPPGGATQPDPVIYLSGGPSASILKMITSQFEIMSEPVFASGRSLIVFDQRGVGLSRPALDCPEFSELTQDLLDRQKEGRALSTAEIEDLALESLVACRARLAEVVDLTAYNSASSAADVHELRQALGYEQVNLWGGSYGTRLALEVMRHYPEDLRSVVLDAVYPPDVDLYLEGPANFQRSLTRLFQSCAGNQVCGQAYPELERVLLDTVSNLNDNPVVREILNPQTGETLDVQISGDVLLALTFQMLYDSKLRYFIPKIIYDVSQGDFDYLDKVYGSMLAMASISSRGMMFSVQCHEELAFSSSEDFQSKLSRFPELRGMYETSILGGLAYRACETWEAGSADPSANEPVRSAVPTLILNGEFDPITPPAWGFRAAETLETAYVFEYPGIGHGASVADSCPLGMMEAFLENPVRQPDANCIAEMLAK